MAGAEGMVTLKLRPGDKQKLDMALKGLVQKANVNTPAVLAQAGQTGSNSCRLKCPYDTGRLRASIGIPNKGGVFQLTPRSVTFGTAVEYALAVELGSKGHWIKPGDKGFLAWKGGPVAQKISFGGGGVTAGKMQYRTKKGGLTVQKGKGGWIFTKKPVWHPPTRGQHFMLRGVEQAVPAMVKILSEGVLR